MQQTSGSSFLYLTDGDECAVGEVAVGEVAVGEVAVGEDAVVVSFLFMVCHNCERLLCLIGWVGLFHGGGGQRRQEARGYN